MDRRCRLYKKEAGLLLGLQRNLNAVIFDLIGECQLFTKGQSCHLI
jgi:hypothetical protein